MKIAIIGSKGIVGTTLVEHFTRTGHRVLPVDLNTEFTLEEAASSADVVFIVVLPIDATASLINAAASVMRPKTLLIHGTSVEKPIPYEINPLEVTAKGITFCHFHFHFRPQAPLTQTLFGQHITINIQGKNKNWWRTWIIEQFVTPYGSNIHHLRAGEHDRITSISQVIHMVVAVLVAIVWINFSRTTLNKAMTIGGLPCRLLIRMVLRVGGGAKVVEDILYTHPFVIRVLDVFSEAIQFLRESVSNRRAGTLVRQLVRARNFVESPILQKWDEGTAELARLEADTQETIFKFRFSKEANVVGLLARVLGEFDKRGIDKTTTIAQVNPDGGCTIIVGIRQLNEVALEAEGIIRSWL